jgi:DNA-binding transcriptional MerR regulator
MVTMAEQAPDNKSPDLPDKLYFKIGEASRIVGVPQYVLRYWETEFPRLAPIKSSGRGHRLYRRKDVELLLEVKRLLYEKRFTIEGARNFLKSGSKTSERKAAPKGKQAGLFPSTPPGLEEIRKELTALVKLLK